MASNGFRPSQKVSNSPTWPQMAIRLINGLQWPLLSSNEGLGSLVKYISVIIWLKNDFSKIKLANCSKKYPVAFFFIQSLVHICTIVEANKTSGRLPGPSVMSGIKDATMFFLINYPNHSQHKLEHSIYQNWDF